MSEAISVLFVLLQVAAIAALVVYIKHRVSRKGQKGV